MADVRSLLKNERASRRIQHTHASYSTTGTLLCVVCHLQLKSESLWEGHLRSAGHTIRLEKLQHRASEQTQNAKQMPEEHVHEAQPSDGNNRKRKASSNEEDAARKRGRPANELAVNAIHPGTVPSQSRGVRPINEIRIPSRPATPLKISPGSMQTTVDEDEWAAFEADIAAAQLPVAEGVAISAPAISAADLAAQSIEKVGGQRTSKEEAEVEGDKEDAERKLEDEFDQMVGLEARVRTLRERREALRTRQIAKSPIVRTKPPDSIAAANNEDDDDEDEDVNVDVDGWEIFRIKG